MSTFLRRIIVCLLLSAATLHAQELKLAKPETVGIDSKRLTLIEALLEDYIEKQQLAGSVTLISRKGSPIMLHTAGKLNVESGTAMPSNGIFRIYSMTKPVTSVAAMILLEQGKFLLDDPVEKYLPEFKNILVLEVGGSPIKQQQVFTVRMLMNHTAGFASGRGSAVIDQQYIKAELFDQPDLASMVETLGQIPLQYQPGSEWHYSVATDVLAHLVEVWSGTSFDEFVQKNIFTPLRMRDTFFQIPDTELARFGTHQSINANTQQFEILDRPDHSSPYVKQVTLFSGSSGLLSTAQDYWRFAQMLLNGGILDNVRVLSPKTVELMTLNSLTNINISDGGLLPPGVGFGLGFAVVENPAAAAAIGSAGEYYWFGAAGTFFWVDPVEEIIVVCMLQHSGANVPLKNQIKGILYGALMD